jgi:hypothetical protein
MVVGLKIKVSKVPFSLRRSFKKLPSNPQI